MQLTKSTVATLLIFAVASSLASSQVSAQTNPTYSFSLSGTSIASCWYWGVMFNASQGQRFSVKWSETGGPPTSLDLYIVAPASISQRWLCDTGPVELYYNSGAFGTANWAAPSAGKYVVLVVNNNYYPASGTLSIMAANATVTATTIGYATARQPPLCLANDCAPSGNR